MAIAILSEVPEATFELYEAVSERIGMRDGLAAGHVVHALGPRAGGGLEVFDVWDSVEAFERFNRERLVPAVRAVAGATLQPPRRRVVDLQVLVTRGGR